MERNRGRLDIASCEAGPMGIFFSFLRLLWFPMQLFCCPAPLSPLCFYTLVVAERTNRKGVFPILTTVLAYLKTVSLSLKWSRATSLEKKKQLSKYWLLIWLGMNAICRWKHYYDYTKWCVGAIVDSLNVAKHDILHSQMRPTLSTSTIHVLWPRS